MNRKDIKKLEHRIINEKIKEHIEEEYDKGVNYYRNVSKNREKHKKDFHD